MPTEDVILSAKPLALCRLSGMALFCVPAARSSKRVPPCLEKKGSGQLMNTTLRKRLLCICETAIFIALAFVLNFAKLEFAWLQGGSISLSMIPILVLSLRRGAAWGIPRRSDLRRHRLHNGRRLRPGHLVGAARLPARLRGGRRLRLSSIKCPRPARWSARWSAA